MVALFFCVRAICAARRAGEGAASAADAAPAVRQRAQRALFPAAWRLPHRLRACSAAAAKFKQFRVDTRRLRYLPARTAAPGHGAATWFAEIGGPPPVLTSSSISLIFCNTDMLSATNQRRPVGKKADRGLLQPIRIARGRCVVERVDSCNAEVSTSD
jgi:hypothetical protein